MPQPKEIKRPGAAEETNAMLLQVAERLDIDRSVLELVSPGILLQEGLTRFAHSIGIMMNSMIDRLEETNE